LSAEQIRSRGRDLDERSSSASVEAVRIERTRDRFDIAEGPT
jgi:hypothetical protein